MMKLIPSFIKNKIVSNVYQFYREIDEKSDYYFFTKKFTEMYKHNGFNNSILSFPIRQKMLCPLHPQLPHCATK